MSLLFLQQWFPEHIVKAFSWTLIHSLWQGLAAALVAGLVILFTRRSSPTVRYNLLSAVLVFFLLTSLLTFYIELNSSDPSSVRTVKKSGAALPAGQQTFISNGPLVSNGANESFLDRFTNYFNEHAPFVALCWFIFFLAKSIQLCSGLHYIHRIRHNSISKVPHYWSERIRQLSDQVGIKSQIQFLQSELVQVPVVIGILKPAILVPIGLFTRLTSEQVEAILLHELAHVRRKDFLVNIIQSFTEAIYFFNPAILWISSLIREEREACCDDLVIQVMPHKRSYLEALVTFQEQRINSTPYAMALGGKKNYLLRRVKRMLTQENKKLNIMEKTILLLGAIGITAFSFIPLDEKPVIYPIVQTEVTIPELPLSEKLPASGTEKMVVKSSTLKITGSKSIKPIRDTIPKTKSKIKTESTGQNFPNLSTSINDDGNTRTTKIDATDHEGKKYSVKKMNGEITELSVDGKRIPKEEYENYHSVLEKIDQQMLRRTLSTSRTEFRDEPRRKMEMQQRINEKQRTQEMQERHERQGKEKVKMKKEIEDRQKDRELRLEKMKSNHKKDLEERHKKITVEKELRKNEKIQRQNEISNVIHDLLSNNIIQNTENLSFSFNNNELIVNGKKQSEELHQQFRKKFINKPGDSFNYNRNGNSTNISVNRE